MSARVAFCVPGAVIVNTSFTANAVTGTVDVATVPETANVNVPMGAPFLATVNTAVPTVAAAVAFAAADWMLNAR